MPVAPYGSEKYRAWNRARMRRRRREGAPWDRNYELSNRGQFMRSTYVNSSRAYILRMNRDHAVLAADAGLDMTPLEPRSTVADLNRYRETLRTIERAGGWEAYRAAKARER